MCKAWAYTILLTFSTCVTELCLVALIYQPQSIENFIKIVEAEPRFRKYLNNNISFKREIKKLYTPKTRLSDQKLGRAYNQTIDNYALMR